LAFEAPSKRKRFSHFKIWKKICVVVAGLENVKEFEGGMKRS
jgi:hypothetical protein